MVIRLVRMPLSLSGRLSSGEAKLFSRGATPVVFPEYTYVLVLIPRAEDSTVFE